MRPLDQSSEPMGMITRMLEEKPLEEKADPPDPPTDEQGPEPQQALVPASSVVPPIPVAPVGKIGKKKKSKTFQEEPEAEAPVEREGNLGIIRSRQALLGRRP